MPAGRGRDAGRHAVCLVRCRVAGDGGAGRDPRPVGQGDGRGLRRRPDGLDGGSRRRRDADRRRCGHGAVPDAAAGIAVGRCAFPVGCAGGLLPSRRQSRRRGREPLRPRLRPSREGAAPRPAVLRSLPSGHESRGAGRRRLHLPGVLGIHVAGVMGACHGAPPRGRQHPSGLCLSRHGELRHAGAAARLRSPVGPGGKLCVRRDPRRVAHAARRCATSRR